MAHIDEASVAHILHRDTKGAPDLELIVAPAESLAAESWTSLFAQALSGVVTCLRPGGPDPDPWISEQFRVDQLLAELGWRRLGALPELVPGVPISTAVERCPQFRTQEIELPDGTSQLVVVDVDGEPVAQYSRAGRSTEDVLRDHGWEAGSQIDGWLMPTIAATPRDWRRIVSDSTSGRAAANAVFVQADRRWRTLVREGVLAGVEVKQLAEWAGVTPQRVYQIRDRRR